MKTEIKTITPDLARQMLDKNSSNRRVDAGWVRDIAAMMMNGEWMEETGEAIKIDVEDDILDGQHRLLGLIKAGKTYKFLVISQLPCEARSKIDTGKKRSAADVLYMSGITKNSTVIAGIISSYLKLKKGRIATSASAINSGVNNAQVLAAYNERVDFWEVVTTKSLSWYKSFFHTLSPSYIGSNYALLYEINSDDADRFFNQLCTGIDLGQSSPVKLLRDKLLMDKENKRKLTAYEKSALLIKAWNFFRQNKECKLLKFDIQRDSFPKAA